MPQQGVTNSLQPPASTGCLLRQSLRRGSAAPPRFPQGRLGTLQTLRRYGLPESWAVTASLSESHWRTRRQPLRPLLAPKPTLREPNSRDCMMRGLHVDSVQLRRGGNCYLHRQLPHDVRPPPLGDPGGRGPGADFGCFSPEESSPPEAWPAVGLCQTSRQKAEGCPPCGCGASFGDFPSVESHPPEA